MKRALLYSLVGLSLSSISFVVQAKDHRSPQVSTNPQFKHYSDFIDIATEDMEDYINHQYITPTVGVPHYVFNHVGTESGDGVNINHNGANGRYNEMFDTEVEFNNLVKRDSIIGDQVMSKYRDSHDVLWLKARQMERYNAERQRLFSQHRTENGWKDINNGTPKIVHLDLYGARVGNYRAEQLAAYRLKTGIAPSGTDTPHEDDYGRNGGQVNADHMNNLGYVSENVMTPRNDYLTFLPHGTATDIRTTLGNIPDITELEKFMFNSGKVDSPMWGSDGYSAFVIERVKSNKDVTKITISDHLKAGLPDPSSPDWHSIGHFVSIMEDVNVDGAGTMVTDKSYATVDEFGMKHASFNPPEGLLHVNGKDYVKVTLKSDDPQATFEADILVDGKAVNVLDSTGKKIYDAGCPWGGVPASSAYDPVKKEYDLYLEVDKTKTSVKIQAYLYNSKGHGTGNFNFFGDKSISRVDPATPPTYADGGVSEGSAGEQKTGDDFRVKDTLFTTAGATQTALLSGPFADKQAIANYQNISVDGVGKVALDDPKTVIEYAYGSVVDQEKLSKNNVAYLSNRGIVMATNGAKAVKLKDTDIFVNEGVLYADDKSMAIEMNAHDNIIQLRNDLIEGVIDGGAGQDTLLLSKPKHQMDERGLDKSALDSDKYVINNITLKNIEQIHAQNGKWYFQKNSTINLASSTLSKATTLPWANNDASGLTDTYDYIPQSGNITFLGDVNIDATNTNSLIYAKNITFKGKITLKHLLSTTRKINIDTWFNATNELSMNVDNIKIDGVTNKEAKLVVGQYDRPVTGLVVLGTSKNIFIVDKPVDATLISKQLVIDVPVDATLISKSLVIDVPVDATLISKSLVIDMPVDATLISKLLVKDKKNVGIDQMGDIATTISYTVKDKINAIGKGSVGVWSGEVGKDITIQQTVTATGEQSKAVELNRKDNILTLHDDITGMIDAGKGYDTMILSSITNTPHHINGEVIGMSNIENKHGEWTFNKKIELYADYNTNANGGGYPVSHAVNSDRIIVPTRPFRGYLPKAYAGIKPFSTVKIAFQKVGNKLIFKGKVIFDVDPMNKKASHISGDSVDLQSGYQVNVTSLVATPNREYSATLINSPDITNENANQVEYNENDGLWKITTNIDPTGLHTTVKARNMVNYKASALDNNDDVTFGISNQVTKYRTTSTVAHDSKFLDFSMVGNTSGKYQNLALISTHLNVSTPLKHEIPFLTNEDKRNLVNIQVGYYHGSGIQEDFNRSVNSYTLGGGLKVYDPFKQKRKTFLNGLWISTGLDLGIAQQYNISRFDNTLQDNAEKGKENDVFLTNTILSGVDLYVHQTNQSNLKLSLTPYVGLGFNFVRLGEYTETANNSLKINSQYGLNMYGIFGMHTQATYKLKNSQLLSLGANLETNLRFNNKGSERTYTYLNFNSSKAQDNTYKRLPITVSLNASYQPTNAISIFTKLNGSSQEIYNYNIAIGAKINF